MKINKEVLKEKLTSFKRGSTLKSFHIAFSQGLVALLFISIDFVFSKKLTVLEFGYLKEMYFILNLGIPLLSFGLPEGFKYFVAQDEKKSSSYFSAIFIQIGAVGTLIFIISLVVNSFHALGIIDIGPYYLISLLFPLPFLCFLLNKVLRYWYINQNLTHRLGLIGIYSFIPSILLLTIGVWQVGRMPDLFMLWALILYTIIFGVTVFFYLRFTKISFVLAKLDLLVMRRMLNYGIPLYIAGFIGVITVRLDKLIVSFFEDQETFAIFSVGAFEVPAFAMLSAAFSQQIFPGMVRHVANGEEGLAKALWLKTTKRVSLITYPIILLCMIFAEELLFFIYSSDYAASVFLFKTYLLVALFRNNSYGILLTAKNLNIYVTRFALVTVVVNLTFSTFLYLIVGVEGIIYGTLLSTIIYTLLVLSKEHMLIEYFKKFLLHWTTLAFLSCILYYYFK